MVGSRGIRFNGHSCNAARVDVGAHFRNSLKEVHETVRRVEVHVHRGQRTTDSTIDIFRVKKLLLVGCIEFAPASLGCGKVVRLTGRNWATSIGAFDSVRRADNGIRHAELEVGVVPAHSVPAVHGEFETSPLAIIVGNGSGPAAANGKVVGTASRNIDRRNLAVPCTVCARRIAHASFDFEGTRTTRIIDDRDHRIGAGKEGVAFGCRGDWRGEGQGQEGRGNREGREAKMHLAKMRSNRDFKRSVLCCKYEELKKI